MADFPDLNTDVIGFIAFWNAFDHGVSEIDPTEVLDYPGVNTFEQFDNGVQGTVTRGYARKTRDLNFRVKDDGWFIIWIDRTNDFAVNSGNPPDNYGDLVNDWTSVSNASELPVTTFSAEINQLQQRLSNSGSITFDHADVGYFNFEFDTATRIGLAAFNISGDFSNPRKTAGIAYAAGTTRFYHAAFGAITSQGQQGRARFAGVTLVDGDANRAGIVDVIADGLMPNAGEFVDGSVRAKVTTTSAGHLLVFTP